MSYSQFPAHHSGHKQHRTPECSGGGYSQKLGCSTVTVRGLPARPAGLMLRGGGAHVGGRERGGRGDGEGSRGQDAVPPAAGKLREEREEEEEGPLTRRIAGLGHISPDPPAPGRSDPSSAPAPRRPRPPPAEVSEARRRLRHGTARHGKTRGCRQRAAGGKSHGELPPRNSPPDRACQRPVLRRRRRIRRRRKREGKGRSGGGLCKLRAALLRGAACRQRSSMRTGLRAPSDVLWLLPPSAHRPAAGSARPAAG